MSIEIVKGFQFMKAFFPSCLVGIPHKTNLIEHLFSFIRQSIAMSIHLQTMLIALSVDDEQARGYIGEPMQERACPRSRYQYNRSVLTVSPIGQVSGWVHSNVEQIDVQSLCETAGVR